MANNKNKKDMNEVFTDLNLWLHSELGKNAQLHDEFSEFAAQTHFDEMLKLGKQMHSIPKSLKHVDRIFKELGASFSSKVLPNGEGTEISYVTPEGDVLGKFVISATEDGYTSVDGQLSANIPTYVRGRNGEVGLASSISIGLDEAAKEMETHLDFLKRQMKADAQRGAKKVRSMFSGAFRDVITQDPRIYSTNQIKDLNNFNQKNLKSRRMESAEAGKLQAITTFYEASLYKAHDVFKKSNAPTQKVFTRQLDEIINKARGFTTFEALEKEVRTKYPWIYKNIWKGDVENFIRPLIGKITQGGMTEGMVGRISFGEPDVPFVNLAAAGKKPTQNLQVLKQNARFARGSKTIASGSAAIFTKTQYDTWKNKIKNGQATKYDMFTDVYTGGELTNEDIYKAYLEIKKVYEEEQRERNKILKRIENNKKNGIKEDLKLPKQTYSDEEFRRITEMALQGFGDDGSLMSEDLTRELGGRYDTKKEKDREYRFADINKEAKARLLAQKQKSLTRLTKRLANLTDSGKEVSKEDQETLNNLRTMVYLLEKEDTNILMNNMNDEPVFKEAKTLIKKILAEKYDLTGKEKIKSFDIDEDGFFKDVYSRKQRYLKTGVLRNVIGDTRTTASMISNILLGRAALIHGYRYEDVYDEKGNLRMHFFEEAGKDLSKKTIRTDVNGKALYIFNELMKKGKTTNEIKESIEKDPFLSKFFEVSEDGKSLITKNSELTREFLGNEKGIGGNREAATELLKHIADWGKSTGVYDSNREYFKELDLTKEGLQKLISEKKLTDEQIENFKEAKLLKDDGQGNLEGKKYFIQTHAMPTAYALGISSPSQWSGGPRDTHSRAKFTWRELLSAESTYGDFRESLLEKLDNQEINVDQYKQAIAPVENFIHTLRKNMREKEDEYDKYVKNAKYLQKTFQKEQEQTKQELRNDRGVILLTLDEIAALDASIDYDEEAYIGKEAFKDKNSKLAAIYLKNKAEEYYNNLSDAEKEKLAKDGIKSAGDLNFGLDLGNNKLRGIVDGEFLETGMIMLGRGSYLEGAAKDGKYAVDDIMRGNLSIIQAVQDYIDANAIEKDSLGYRALATTARTHRLFGESYRNGPVYDDTHTLVNNASGYLLLKGQSEHAKEILSEIITRYGDPNTKDANAIKNQKVSLMNTEDFIQILMAQAKESKEDQQKIEDWYYSLTGEKKGKSLQIETIIKRLADFYDISGKNFKGKVFNSPLINRQPTINFNDDFIGGGFLLTHNTDVVEKGTLMISKSVAALGKGDMDGDLVAFQNALVNGDVAGASEALAAYYADYASNIEKISKEAQSEKDKQKKVIAEYLNTTIERIGETGDINSVLDEEGKKVTAAAMWRGKAGAGIWGDEKFATEIILGKLGLGGENRQERSILGLGSRSWAAIFQTLYQEGINIKNLKSKEWENLSKDEQAAQLLNLIDETLSLTGQAATWDDETKMEHLFDNMKKLGIIDEDKMFKQNTLVNLGLKDIKKGSEELKDLEALALKTEAAVKERYGADSEQAKRIQKDIEAIKKVANGDGELTYLSREMIFSLIRNLFEAPGLWEGESAGKQMEKRYNENIPGKSNRKIPLLGRSSGKVFDEETFEYLERLGYDTRGIRNQYHSDSWYAQIKAGDFLRQEVDPETKRAEPRWTTTTAELKEKISKPSMPIDFELTNLVKEYYNPFTEKERKEKIIEELRSGHQPEMIKDSIPALLAITRGTISHRMAEVLDKANQDNLTPQEAVKFFTENEEYKKEIDEWSKELELIFVEKFKGKDKATDRENFILDALRAGAGNYSYIMNKMRREGGTKIGSEIPIAGFSAVNSQGNYNLLRQIVDFMYYTVDEETGRKIIHQIDWKNNASGSPKAENIIQGKDYVTTMQNVNREIMDLNKDGQVISSLEQYLGMGTKASEALDEVIKAMADYASGKDPGNPHNPKARNKNRKTKAWSDAYNSIMEQEKKLFDVLKDGDVGFAFDLIVNNGKGVIGDYGVDLYAPLLTDVFFNYYKKEGINLENFLGSDKKGIETLVATSLSSRFFDFNGTNRQASDLFKDEYKGARKDIDSYYATALELEKVQYEIQRLANEREVNPKLSARRQEKLNQLYIKSLDLQDKIGSKTDFAKAKELYKQIEEKNRELDNTNLNSERAAELKQEIADLNKEVSQYTSTLYYKRERAYEKLGTHLLYSNGEEIPIGGSLTQDIDIYNQQKLADNKDEFKKFRALAGRRDLVQYVSEYEQASKEAAAKRAEATYAPFLTDIAREEAEKNAQEAEEIRDALKRLIIENTKYAASKRRKKNKAPNGYGYFDEAGKSLTLEEAEKRKLYIDIDKTDEVQKDAADKEARLSSYRQKRAFETKAIQYFEDLAKLEKDKESFTNKLEDAKTNGNVDLVNYYEEEIKRVNELIESYDKLDRSQLKKILSETEDGKKILENAENYVKLKQAAEKSVEAQKKATTNKPAGSGNGNGGFGFLGIDSATTRWLSRMMNGGLIYAFIRRVRQGFKDLTNKAKQLDQAMTNLRIVTGKNSEDARTLIGSYARLGKELGATTIEVTNAAQAWLRQGYDIAQVNDLVTASMYLSKLGMIDTATATQNLKI